jgi:hypothetical protein
MGNETGSFPFSRGSDAATFARASKEKSMPHSPIEGQSLQGTIFIFHQYLLSIDSRSFDKKEEISMSKFNEAQNDGIIMIGSARQKHDPEDQEDQDIVPEFIHQSNIHFFIPTRT